MAFRQRNSTQNTILKHSQLHSFSIMPSIIFLVDSHRYNVTIQANGKLITKMYVYYL